MPIITPDQVFDFCSVKTDIREKQTPNILTLITRKTRELEETLNRKLISTTVTNILFQDYVNCKIFDNEIYLKGIYRDLYSITSIYENDVLLTASTGYADGNDYYFDIPTHRLIRIGQNWSTSQLAIKITGKVGLVDTTTEATRQDVVDILIEMVAAKSGLWKTNVQTEGGDITTVRMNVSSDTQKNIDRLKGMSV